MKFYDAGRDQALLDLGLLYEVKEAKVMPIMVRARKNPFVEIHRRINRAFRLRLPKFDLTRLLKRMLRNPFSIPRRQMSGSGRPIRM